MEHYLKRVSFTESERHFIYVEQKARKIFPPISEEFIIVVNDKEFRVKIDNQGRIWANANLREHINFEPFGIVVFTKKEKSRFKLVCAHY